MTTDELKDKAAEQTEAHKLAEKEGITVAAAADRLRQRESHSMKERKKQEPKVDGG